MNDISAPVYISDPESARVDFLLAGVRKRVILIAGIALLFTAAMIGLAFWLTPQYRGEAVLAPAHTDKNSMNGLGSALDSMSGGFAALAGLGLGNDDEATDEALAVLKSQQLTEEFIQKYNLMPLLFPRQWDAKAGTWKAGLKKIPTLFKGYKIFDHVRKIEKDQKTGLITLTIDWKDRLKAAQWTNDLVELLNEEMRRRAAADADASVGYLQKEYGDTASVTTREAISRLMETQIKQQMIAHVTTEYSLRLINRAIPADADTPVWPNKILFAGIGLVFGTVLGVVVSLLLAQRQASRAGFG